MRFANVIILCVVGALASLLSTNPDLFALTRSDVTEGESWRLVTGHFVHFSGNHLVLNFGALALLLHLLPRLSRREFIWLVVVAPVAISVCLLLTRPQLKMYGGLSGWLSGLFVFAALAHRRHEGWTKYIYLVGLSLFVLKTLIESSTSRSLFVILDNGVVVEPAAHVIGAVIGSFGVLFGSRKHSQNRVGEPTLRMENKKAVPEGTA